MTEPVLPASLALNKSPAWWERGICCLVIAWSAAFVLVPSFRGVELANFAASVLFVGWAARRLFRDRREGLLGMSPTQLYEIAKAGRRLRVDPLETATIAAYALTAALQMYAVWP